MTWKPAEIPDETLVYVPGFGETTAGAMRRPLAASDDDLDDATIRMWISIHRYSPKARPWETGYITHDRKQYPLSIFDDDRLISLIPRSMGEE